MMAGENGGEEQEQKRPKNMGTEIEEVKADGLKREFAVAIDPQEIARRIEIALMDLRDKVRLKGFRPGKAPLSLLEKLYGEAVFGEVAEEAIKEHTDRLFRERKLRPAMQPEIEVETAEREQGIRYTIKAEVLPEIDVRGFKAPKLERVVGTVTDDEVEAALERLAAQARRFEPAAKNYKAKTGDVVVVDFVGRVDGEEFEGGKAENAELELGAAGYIPGFEDQLVGAKAGEERIVKVTFPEDYRVKELAGREAEFTVNVKEVKKPTEAVLDDELARQFGMENLEALKRAITEQLEQEAKELSRQQVKRALLDRLSEMYDFPVPEGMVRLEYRDIWEQIKRDLVASGEGDAEELREKEEPDDEGERAEFLAIAERRVRLGLLLSELGLANNIEISRDELMRKVAEEARRFPGQEQQVFEYFTKNPQAMAQLRAPIYEDKVVDYILELAEVEERTVPLAELRRIVTEGEAAAEGGAEAKKSVKTGKKAKPSAAKASAAKQKKASAKKKAPAKKAAGGVEEGAEKKTAPAKKTAAKKSGTEQKAATKKASAKKSTAKKSTAKKSAAKGE
ncbi:MAG: trigger factor [Alphaproteobacteria bacterium]|nr:MAG: trigger factor [Alphaproteobacteria bacterium]